MILQENNATPVLPNGVLDRSAAVGDRHAAAVGRGARVWRRIARSTLLAATPWFVAEPGPAVAVDVGDLVLAPAVLVAEAEPPP